MEGLKSIFEPKSIAIIGASTKEGSVGNDVVRNLVQQGYLGKIYPVNPKTDRLYGLYCYNNILDIEDDVELAICIVPAVVTLGVMQEAAQRGVKGAIVISAGFKEIGNDTLEKEIAGVCRDNNIALVGPNCLGVINPYISMNASFAQLMPDEGHVAFLSQSGALCTAVLDYAQNLGIGFSRFASMGNKALVDEVAMLEYLAQDENTKIIALYVEELRDAQKIIQITKKLRALNSPKPVIVIKSGRTQAGASASASHTGSLSGDDAAYDALFEQAGIIRAKHVSELFEYLQVFSNNPHPKGNRVAIITNAGGPGVLTTDEAISNGLTLAELSDESSKALTELLPEAANIHNPIDVLGDARSDRYEKTLDIVAKDEKVDSILVVLTPQSMTEVDKTAKAIIKTKKISGKPIFASFMGSEGVMSGVDLMRNEGVAANHFPERAAKAMAALTQYTRKQNKDTEAKFVFEDLYEDKVRMLFSQAQKEGKKSFPEADALEIFRSYGFPTLRTSLVKSADEAYEKVKEIGDLVAMKIVSQDILHKSDVGGVALNVSRDSIQDEYERMMRRIAEHVPTAQLEGVLLAEMAPKDGVEVILGSIQDQHLGPLIMVGLGGIYVEIFRDVSFGLAPINREDARRMIEQLQSKTLLEGARGGKKMDIEALIDAMGRLSQMLVQHKEIKELDINPLLVLPEGRGVRLLDGRIVLE